MFKWYRRLKYKFRIEAGYCGFCSNELVWINLFDGEMWRPAKICPELHSGYMCYINYNSGILGLKDSDEIQSATFKNLLNKKNPGAPMIIPDEWMKVMVVKLDAKEETN